MTDLPSIEALLRRLATIDFSQSSEQATREMAVNPVIGVLGWDTFNPDEVAREYSVLGGRVDYCLRGQTRNLVLIEVKRAGTDLSEHQEQLLRYAFDGGVPLAVLTDGLVWWLYLPMAGGSWEQRRFFHIDFRERDAGNAALAIHRFLNRDGLVDGTAVEAAQREFESQERDRRVRAALQEAWRRVLDDPHGLLRDLLAETVQEISGDVPDREALADFLQEIAGSESTGGESPVTLLRTEEHRPLHRRVTPSRQVPYVRKAPSDSKPSAENQDHLHTESATPRPTKQASASPTAFWLDGSRYEVRTWRMVLIRLCEQLSRELGPAFTERVTALRGRKRPYFSSSAEELRDPLHIPGTNLFVEGNISSSAVERLARQTLRVVRDTDGDFRIQLSGQSIYSEFSHDRPDLTRRVPRRATKRMSARVEQGHLLVGFAGGLHERWELPDRSDKGGIRRVRNAAVAFAHRNKATLGQINAVKKALTEAGYYLTQPRSQL